MSKENIDYLIDMQLWEEIPNTYSPLEVAKEVSFKNGLRIAYRLLYNKKWEENLQEYSIELLNKLREIYSTEWNSSWQNDALLGLACYIRYKHEDRFYAFKRAFEKAKHPPPGLLIELARCSICPGSPPITYDTAIDLTKKAIRDVPYVDGVSLLCNLYSNKNDKENMNYWSALLESLNSSGQKITSPPIEPEFLQKEYLDEINSIKKKN